LILFSFKTINMKTIHSFSFQRMFSLMFLFSLLACSDSNIAPVLSPDLQISTHASSFRARIPEFPASPAEFVTEITNPYLAFQIGKKFYYEGETDEGFETIVVEVTAEKKIILGISTTVVHDQAFLDGELVEDTFDWLAQDSDGNVWYFGEDSKEIEDGEVVSSEGSWEAGVDGALPGLLMPASPENGMKYQQEFAEDIAEDMAIVINTSKTVEIESGTYEGCLETLEFTPLEPGQREHKYYSPGLGLILELSPRGGRQSIELVSVFTP
jgi:hypothetical protein